jgi:hypothetical protein
MTQRATSLRIPSPCAESWAAMTPTSGGRHCTACAKTVVDFTQKTDAEILAYLAQASGQACGRFKAGQLERPLQPAESTNRWRSWLASVLALGGVLGSGRVAAQAGSGHYNGGPIPVGSTTAIPAAPAVPKIAKVPNVVPGGAGGPLVARGIVTDATTGDRLPGVTVLLQGTTRGVSTDADGVFELPFTEQDAQGTLLISFVGYTNQPIAVASATAAIPLAISLKADVMGMGEVIVVGGYNARRPYPWHPRALYQWSKYWLTRPFRP